MSEPVTARLERRGQQVDERLRQFFASRSDVPRGLVEAMLYSIEAGGKRLRPALVLECCTLCGGTDDDAMPAAMSIECVHTFSLIHDDLPAMDDDDLRRGRPTSHRVFGEAMAILAGDALLTVAFEILARHDVDAARSLEMIRVLAESAGGAGMIGGQVLDIAATAPSGDERGDDAPSLLDRVREIHLRKTAALLRAACRLGGISAGADSARRAALDVYGCGLGLAVQAVDDLLDVTGNSAALGKSAGKDARTGKLTLARCVSLAEGWKQAEALAAEAVGGLHLFGAAARPLEELARFVVTRST